MSDNPLIPLPAAWEIEGCQRDRGWRVRIHGEYVMDGETGEPSVFYPPSRLTTVDDLHAWSAQLKRTIAKLSGADVPEQPMGGMPI